MNSKAQSTRSIPKLAKLSTRDKPLMITELQAAAKKVDAQHWELQYWPNGLYFVESPSGEGTEVPEEAVSGALAQLFRTFF